MLLGDSGRQEEVFIILQYAIENDSDPDVVMAALKRIHKFKENKDLALLPEIMKRNKDIKNYEPYYSMALLNLEIITEEEFTKILQ